MTEQDSTRRPRGARSFCVPRAAIQALLEAEATAYEICAYLTLANYTDETGVYSTASLNAVMKATGSNKTIGGPIHRAIERLKTIHVKDVERVSNGLTGKRHQMVDKVIDLGPILFDRESWEVATGEVMPDGPTARGKIMHVLPAFDEPVGNRVWIGSGLVDGIGTFTRPLKTLKDLGDLPARLLLAMYAAVDMPAWGGVRPVSMSGQPTGPYRLYDARTVGNVNGGATIIRAQSSGTNSGNCSGLVRGKKYTNDDFYRAVDAIESAGFFYPVVMAINRANPEKYTFPDSGGTCDEIPRDAEPLYELGIRKIRGIKTDGEEGLGYETWRAAMQLAGDFLQHQDGQYYVIVRRGQPVIMAGIFRPTFRVANAKNAGVRDTWQRIEQNNHDAREFIQAILAVNGIEQPQDGASKSDPPIPF